MKVGIDLDNTIISYDSAFRHEAEIRHLIDLNSKLDKQGVRENIIRKCGNDIEWQKLQGYVYGKGISKAKLFEGVYRFLWRCHINNVMVEVVSHKTIYGHFDDEKINLREAANQFLDMKGIFGNKNSFIKKITYENTKINKINKINFDYFIDDLHEIVYSDTLKDQKTILFSPNMDKEYSGKKNIARSWSDISRKILGEWDIEEVFLLIKTINSSAKISKIEKINGRGNSEIYKAILDDYKDVIIKIYPQTRNHDRIVSEYLGIKNLYKIGFENIQKPVGVNKKIGIAMYQYINGNEVSSYNISDLQQVLDLLSKLHDNRKDKLFSKFQLASDACLSGKDIEGQIDYRLNKLLHVSKEYSDLDCFLRKDFVPKMNEIVNWSRKVWSGDLKYSVKMDRERQTLSPSDLGFHNTFKLDNGKLMFHDFEYFGWDDPVKLVADFSHHAAMNFTDEMEKYWFNGVSNIYGKKILSRLRCLWPLYGLNWCLIILNEFKSDVWNRRCVADSSKIKNREYQLITQLRKAEQKLHYVYEIYKDKEYW